MRCLQPEYLWTDACQHLVAPSEGGVLVGGPERLQEKERVNWTEKLCKQCLVITVGGPEHLQEKERVNWSEKLRKQCHHCGRPRTPAGKGESELDWKATQAVSSPCSWTSQTSRP